MCVCVCWATSGVGLSSLRFTKGLLSKARGQRRGGCAWRSFNLTLCSQNTAWLAQEEAAGRAEYARAAERDEVNNTEPLNPKPSSWRAQEEEAGKAEDARAAARAAAEREKKARKKERQRAKKAAEAAQREAEAAAQRKVDAAQQAEVRLRQTGCAAIAAGTMRFRLQHIPGWRRLSALEGPLRACEPPLANACFWPPFLAALHRSSLLWV